MWKSTFFKIVIRVVLFLMVFTGAALIADLWYNRGSGRAYVELGGATLPVVYTYCGEERMTCLPAYRQDMEPSLIRDSILPVSESREVSFSLDKRGSSIGEVSYQLRDSVGETLIEEGQLELTELREGVSFCTAKLRMDLKKGRQYIFVLRVQSGEDQLRFYTRVVLPERSYVSEFLAEAERFHKLLLSEKTDPVEKEIKTYILEDAPEGYDKEDMGFVSLFSSYEALCWNGMKPEQEGLEETSLTELYDDGGTVVYRYTIHTVEEETQEIRTYRVEEHFVMEYVPELAAARVKDYFRRMNRQFTNGQFEREINGIRIGTEDRPVAFRTSEDNEHTVFGVDGGIWYFDYNQSTLTRIYGSDSDMPGFTGRENYVILSVDDKEAYFAVYGRISSGEHEGENGILVEQFTEENRQLTECAFISTNLPYEWISKEAGRLLYLNTESKTLFFLLNGTLHSLDLKTKEETVLAEGLSIPDVLVSRDGSVIAFASATDKTGGAEELILWDLAGGKKTAIRETGMRLQALTFIGEDFVYGTAKPEHVSLAADGHPVFLYSNLKILHRDGTEGKNYGKSGMVISEAKFLDNTIYLTRLYVNAEGESLSEASPDFITYKLEDEKGRTILSRFPGVDGYAIVYPDNIYLTSIPETLIARKEVGSGAELRVNGETDSKLGYLFRAGEMLDLSERIGTMVRTAVEQRGYVVLRDGSTLYRNRTGAPYLTVADKVKYQKAEEGDNGYAACLAMSLQMAGAETAYGEVRKELEAQGGGWDQTFEALGKGEVRGLNLSGADLDTAVLFLGEGIPFATKLGSKYVFVVSFNSDAIRYYDPASDSEVRVDRNTFKRNVDEAGDEFYAYVN